MSLAPKARGRRQEDVDHVDDDVAERGGRTEGITPDQRGRLDCAGFDERDVEFVRSQAEVGASGRPRPSAGVRVSCLRRAAWGVGGRSVATSTFASKSNPDPTGT